ncbi:hypothetical protein HII31_11616 [Pseudocercospora fuligena]|uniref:Uncharacterized protein n=1 Tax=Pseudocercospora fuligena TaxID=685502 RepID=A0A8H6RAM9_9PEZI|nr:hypothetical protein HII31_11616 [Pseudocercospora fuligena]
MATPQKPSLREQARRIQVDDIAGLWNLDQAIKEKFQEGYEDENKVRENLAQIHEACQYQLARNNIPGTFEARYHHYMVPVVIKETNAIKTGNFDDPRWHCRQAKSIYEGLRPRLPENGLDIQGWQSFMDEIEDSIGRIADWEEEAAAERREAEAESKA